MPHGDRVVKSNPPSGVLTGTDSALPALMGSMGEEA